MHFFLMRVHRLEKKIDSSPSASRRVVFLLVGHAGGHERVCNRCFGSRKHSRRKHRGDQWQCDHGCNLISFSSVPLSNPVANRQKLLSQHPRYHNKEEIEEIGTFTRVHISINANQSWSPESMSPAESFDRRVNDVWIHSCCRQKPNVSGCLWVFWRK